jgi:hypothetical protein
MHAIKEKKSVMVRVYAHAIIAAVSCVMTAHMYGSPVFLDNFFSASWYEKGLSSTIFAWNKICSFINEKNDDGFEKELDIILGKCAFARFCLEKMNQNNQPLLEEDIVYFAALLQKIDRIVGNDNYSVMHNNDYNDCIKHMIVAMKKQLQVPRNI